MSEPQPSWINHTEVAPAVFVVRFLKEPTADSFADFTGVCTVVFGRRVATMYAMHGLVRRQHIRAMCQWSRDKGASVALAKRVEGHRLPGAVERADGWLSIDLKALGERL